MMCEPDKNNLDSLIVIDRRLHTWCITKNEYGIWSVISSSSLPTLVFSFEHKLDAIAFSELLKIAI